MSPSRWVCTLTLTLAACADPDTGATREVTSADSVVATSPSDASTSDDAAVPDDGATVPSDTTPSDATRDLRRAGRDGAPCDDDVQCLASHCRADARCGAPPAVGDACGRMPR